MGCMCLCGGAVTVWHAGCRGIVGVWWVRAASSRCARIIEIKRIHVYPGVTAFADGGGPCAAG